MKLCEQSFHNPLLDRGIRAQSAATQFQTDLQNRAALYILKGMTNRIHFGFIIRYWRSVAAQAECSR